MIRACALAAAAWLAAAPALAAEGLQVETAWSRPAAAGTTGAGFFTLVNHGKADALVGAESPLAQKVEMHASKMTGGVMSMSAESRVPVPAGGQVSFAPGGRHLMLVGLKKPLRAGDHVPATLRFESGKTLKIEFAVSPTAPQAAGHMQHMDHMSGMGDMPGMH